MANGFGHGWIVDAAGRHAAAAMRDGLVRGMAYSLEAAGPGVGKELRKFEQVIRKQALNSDVRRRIHEQQARNAQQAMIGSYTSTLGKNRTSPPGYRSNDTGVNRRYSGGALLRALQDPAVVGASADSILLANTDLLDAEAAHWYRLNFGAGAAGSGSLPPTPIVVQQPDGRTFTIGRYGLGMPRSDPFAIPGGVWVGQEFYPRSSSVKPPRPGVDAEGNLSSERIQDPRITKGIESRNFIDAGLRAVVGGVTGHARSGPSGPGKVGLAQMYANEALTAAERAALRFKPPPRIRGRR